MSAPSNALPRFRTVSQSLLDIASDSKHLGAEIGGMAILHTWGGQLQHHPHLHCVLPAGGLAPDGSRWVPCRPNFFLPVRVLSRRFRRLYVEGLKHLYDQGELALTGRCQQFAEPRAWKRLLASLREQEWVVYAKEPCDSAHIFKYLARYTHRVAISNHPLLALQDGQVSFRFKDHKRGGKLRTQTLDAVEFLRRFCLHILPKGLHKIRYFGFMANCHRQAKLALGRPNRPESVAHFLDLLIRAQSPVGMGVIGQNYWVQKPVKEFVPKRAFLDTPSLPTAAPCWDSVTMPWCPTRRHQARTLWSPIARAPRSSQAMPVRCATRDAWCSSRLITDIGRPRTCRWCHPDVIPHEEEAYNDPQSRRWQKANTAEKGGVRPKPTSRWPGEDDE